MSANENKDEETARVAMLRSLGVLDTPAEDRFDRYTSIVKQLFDTDIVLVSLVDQDRQWFKSRVGLEATETPRDISFCAHAIKGDELFIINDATKDDRFANNPLVTSDPHIRFYAGYPLQSTSGYKLGTLCIIDTKPRAFDQSQLELLGNIAGMVSRELEVSETTNIDMRSGLINWYTFERAAEKSLAYAKREQQGITMVSIDLDNFLEIEEALGESVATRALQEFSTIMLERCRDGDNVASWGGDRFGTLLPNTDEKGGWQLVERYRKILKRHNALPGRQYKLRFTAGVVQYDPSQHVNLADLAASAKTMMDSRKRFRIPRSAVIGQN